MKIGWVDFSKEERDRAFEFLRLFQEVGAVDELGIGIVRDAFADIFFPGTSTLMTRAKYFVAVPYIINEKIEEGAKLGWTAHETLSAINDMEKIIAKKLIGDNPNERHIGVIGSSALHRGKWVKRSPSELYWNGIRTLGIQRDRGMSLLQYISAGLDNLRARGVSLGAAYRDEMSEGDDIDAGCVFGFRPMDVFGLCKKDWKKSIDISLTNREAKYLRDKIQTNLSESVWAYALRANIDLSKYNGNFFAFAEEMSPVVDKKNKRMLELACYFSFIVYVARVRYNVLLQGNRNDEAKQEWDEILYCKKPKTCPMDEVFKALRFDRGYAHHRATMKFLLNLEKCFHSRKWELMDCLIRQRELNIKGSVRAKLANPEKYSSKIWVSGRYLDYRLSVAARITQDIMLGLEDFNA